MPRQKLVSDAEVLDAALTLFASGGERAVSFQAVGTVAGLAPATLVQRFISRDAMLAAALMRGWDAADAALQRCEALAPPNGQNAVAFLKRLAEALAAVPLLPLVMAAQGDARQRSRAGDWRRAVEAALASRIGKGPDKANETAAALFAAWQGRMLWAGTTGAEFRLGALVKRRKNDG